MKALAVGLGSLASHLVPLRVAARRALLHELSGWMPQAEQWLQELAAGDTDGPTSRADIPVLERVALNTLFFEFGSWPVILPALREAKKPLPLRDTPPQRKTERKEVQPHADGP